MNRGDWNWDQDKNYDLLFYERYFNGEVTAGGYGVRNNPITREFLKMWAELQFQEPKGFSSSDNGAIHVALMKWFIGKDDTAGSSIVWIFSCRA